MSNMMLADFDRDVGCCSCLGFLRKAGREMNSFTGDREFLIQDGSFYGPNGYVCNNTDGSKKKLVSFPKFDRPICREKPVRETYHLVAGEDEEGNKMINEYVRVCTIGRGSYGKVVLYRNTNDGIQYAIKILETRPRIGRDESNSGFCLRVLSQAFYKSRLSKVRVSSSETAMTDVRREVSIMKLLEHPNIVNLVEVIDDPESDRFYMVLEYVEGKWVCDASGEGGGIGEITARRYLRDMIAGLMYLHAHDIIHGDIKPENLLVTRDGSVKIGDFSVSQVVEDGNDELWRSPGTPVFTAPECCLGFSYNGKAADVWALGVTLYCMIFGNIPFIGESLQETYDKIVNAPLSFPDELDPELKDLLEGLLCKDPKKRLKLDVAAKHPWVVRERGPVPQSSCRCKTNNLQKENGSSQAKND